MSAQIYELPAATLENVADVLRAIADEVEAGKYGPACAAVVIVDADDVYCFGAGDAACYKALYLMERAKRILVP